MHRPIDKGKKKANKSSEKEHQMQSYKAAFSKTQEQLKAETLEKTPKERRLRDDAYALAVKSNQTNEYVYPYVPLSTEWICPIEDKYSHLSAGEISTFYLREYADPFLHPKAFQYYFSILSSTHSVDFDSVTRTGTEWAYSKAFIKRVITPAEWQGDLYTHREVAKEKRIGDKPWFNYFDYIKAWRGAFCYENRKYKHSWFLQFRDCETTNFPQWFIYWFSDWGLNPIVLPDNVRKVFEDFSETNQSMKNKELMFSVLYQVPWILKWDVIIRSVPIRKFDVLQGHIPYLGRRILIKWWEKYEFFEDSIFSKKGIINLEPPKAAPPPPIPKRDLSEILGELIKNSPKKDLKDLRRLLQQKLAEEGSDDDEPEKISEDESASASHQDDDDVMQDSQFP